MQRIVVIGTSGSGKTTLARTLSHRLHLPHVELDALHWGPNWTATPKEVMRHRVRDALAGDRWSVCGNYNSIRDVIWERADTIIWLDYAMPVVCGRLARRTLARCWRRETLWAGNRETLFTQFFTRDSLFLYVLKTWRQHRRNYPRLLAEQSQRGVRVVCLRTPAQAAKFVASVSGADGASTSPHEVRTHPSKPLAVPTQH